MRIIECVSRPIIRVALCAVIASLSHTAGWAQEGQPPATQPAAFPPPPPAPPPAPPPKAAEEEGLTATPTGLKYKDLKVGDGAQPQKGDKVKVHYTGTLEDGSTFDSSVESGKPLEFRLGLQRPQVIAGWEEGVVGMKAGGKRILVVPSQLGYGLRGRQPKIPPNATLRFEIELIEVIPGPRLSETRKEDEVPVPSGARYVEVKPGEGEPVAEGCSVKVRAATWSSDGVLMNTTMDQADPMTVELGKVSLPVREGMLGMKAGGTRKLFVPKATPATTQAASQPANAEFTVVQVELVEVVAPPKLTEVPDDQLVTTPSGLKYYDLKVGDGTSPQPTSRVKVHYTGWFTDGKVFDSSVMRGNPTELGLNQFVKGWIEGVGSMKVGGKRRLVIPPDLAYGEKGTGGIPPNSTLIFDVELLEITKP